MKMFKVQDKEFTKLISPYCNLETGPWVAGGSVRKVWQGLPWQEQDIDFFFNGYKQFVSLKDRINEFGVVEKYCHVTDNAMTYKVNTDPTAKAVAANDSIFNVFSSPMTLTELNQCQEKPKLQSIQLIRRQFFACAADVLHSFDFGLAQFITDGNVILTTNQALQDCTDKMIRVNPRHTKPINPSRLIKYAAYGFNPEIDLFKKAVKAVLEQGVSDDSY